MNNFSQFLNVSIMMAMEKFLIKTSIQLLEVKFTPEKASISDKINHI
jgi:hypothetical protein